MKTYSKEFIEAFVHAYSRNVACASDEAVNFEDGMGWEQLRDKHEYSYNVYDALCMFTDGRGIRVSVQAGTGPRDSQGGGT
jgi:hypothetical protein